MGGVGGFSLRVLLPTLLLVAGLVAIYNWQQDQRAADLEELDAQLLTDDLPIDAYLDRGFEAWLKKVSRRTDARDPGGVLLLAARRDRRRRRAEGPGPAVGRAHAPSSSRSSRRWPASGTASRPTSASSGSASPSATRR